MDPIDLTHSKSERLNSLFVVICVVFSSLLILSNITLKVFYIPWFPNYPMTSGIITYPITFLITDFVSEVYGAKKARFMILMGFCMNLLMVLFIQAILHLPCHASWLAPNNPFGYTSISDYQTACSAIFGINGMIFFGSMVAYLVAQLLDIKLFCYIKKKTNNRKLWLRNNISTCLSQLIDSLIMGAIVLGWGLKLSLSTSSTIMFSEYLFKVIFALLDTPFIYLFVYLLRRRFKNYENFKTT